jgi:hypothetical protein
MRRGNSDTGHLLLLLVKHGIESLGTRYMISNALAVFKHGMIADID